MSLFLYNSVGDDFMSLTYIIYCVTMIASAAFAIINIISTLITKKVLKALVNFVWLLITVAVFVCTWIYFQGFTLSVESFVLIGAEINYVLSGVVNDILIAKVVLFGYLVVLVILIIYLVLLITRFIRGVDRAAKKTTAAIKDTANKTSEAIKGTVNKTTDAVKETVNKTTEAVKETTETVKNVFVKKEDKTEEVSQHVVEAIEKEVAETTDLQNENSNIK